LLCLLDEPYCSVARAGSAEGRDHAGEMVVSVEPSRGRVPLRRHCSGFAPVTFAPVANPGLRRCARCYPKKDSAAGANHPPRWAAAVVRQIESGTGANLLDMLGAAPGWVFELALGVVMVKAAPHARQWLRQTRTRVLPPSRRRRVVQRDAAVEKLAEIVTMRR